MSSVVCAHEDFRLLSRIKAGPPYLVSLRIELSTGGLICCCCCCRLNEPTTAINPPVPFPLAHDAAIPFDSFFSLVSITSFFIVTPCNFFKRHNGTRTGEKKKKTNEPTEDMHNFFCCCCCCRCCVSGRFVMAITAVARLPCRINIKRKETTTTTTASIMYRRTYVDPVHLYQPRDSIFPFFSYTTGTFISKGRRKNKLGDFFLSVDF